MLSLSAGKTQLRHTAVDDLGITRDGDGVIQAAGETPLLFLPVQYCTDRFCRVPTDLYRG